MDKLNGKVRLQGKQPLSGALDLGKASLTLHNSDGRERRGRTAARRQWRGHPAADLHGSSRWHGNPGATSRVRTARSRDVLLEVKNRDPKKGILEFTLKAEDGVIVTSRRCAANSQRTGLTTRLTLERRCTSRAGIGVEAGLAL